MTTQTQDQQRALTDGDSFPNYLPNPDFPEDFQASEGALQLAFEVAKKVGAVAEELAPVLSGDLKGSIKVAAGFVDKVAIGRVYVTDFKGHWIEFGTRRDDTGGRAQPFLRPAAEQVTGQPPADAGIGSKARGRMIVQMGDG